MKKIAMLFMLFASPLMAQTSPGLGSPLANLNLANLSSLFREDFSYDQHGVKWFGLHIPLIDVHDKAGDEIVNFNGGLMWAGSAPSTSNLTSGSPSGFDGSISLRLDYLLKKINGTHVTTPMLPKIELGPMGGYLTAQKEWVYGFQVSTTFGQ